MIRRALRAAVSPRSSGPRLVPYDMFDLERTAREAKTARNLERIYHKGQDKIWDGRQVLTELVEKHGGRVDLEPAQRDALRTMFSIILWGELAAWKVSAELAAAFEPLEARMAATSQAHDEARHFYVMYDYLQLLDYEPSSPPTPTARILEMVAGTNSLAKKLVGMQLMVEPIALTLFQIVRQSGIEPILCELLPYFERDEARHVGLGTNYLPEILKGMSRAQAVSYWAWQGRLFALEAQSLASLEPSFRALGIDPRDAFRLGQAKQLKAAEMLAAELGHDLPIIEGFRAFFEFIVTYRFPEEPALTHPAGRFAAALRSTLQRDVVQTTIDPTVAPAW